MKIAVHSSPFELTDALQSYTQLKAEAAFSRYSPYIKSISIVLEDINGPRGGRDKKCRIYIALINKLSLVISETQTDLYNAINKAIHRSGNTLSRTISRQRKHRHIRFDYPDPEKRQVNE